MPTLLELVRSHTDLDEDDVSWLQLLQADWQIVADLSFADLVLWLPDQCGDGFWAAAQMRPTTGPTAYVDDVVGSFVPTGRRPMLDRAYADPTVKVFRTSISPDNEASLALSHSFGLLPNGEQWDEEDGLEIVYELSVVAGR